MFNTSDAKEVLNVIEGMLSLPLELDSIASSKIPRLEFVSVYCLYTKQYNNNNNNCCTTNFPITFEHIHTTKPYTRI